MPRGPAFPSFLLATIVLPVGVAALVAGAGWLGVKATASTAQSGDGQASTQPASQPASSQPASRPADLVAGPIEHATLDAALAQHVDADGFVEYAALADNRDGLDEYLQSLATLDLSSIEGDEKLATLINAYNAFMLELVLDAWPIENVERDLEQPFEKKHFTLGGKDVSLNEVEHEMIRKEFDEPRIHWAVVCGAFSCPKLRSEAYTADKLEDQLQEQAEYVHNGPRYVEYDGGDTIRLTPLYDWYAEDFNDGDALTYAAQFLPALKDRLDAGNPPAVEFLDYSWAVNDVSNREQLPE